MQELPPSIIQLSFPAGRADADVLFEPAASREEPRLELRDCWWIIRKHIRPIAIFFFGTVLAAAALLLLMPPTYTAETTLLIERRTPRVLDIREVTAESLVPDEYDYYKTQYELLKSRALAARVIRALSLEAGLSQR